MKLALTECGVMKYQEIGEAPEPAADMVVLKVVCCAICRTDAKMWRQGHRDLVLPRVLGHEIAGIDASTGRLYTVWPGQVCGTCRYCLGGRENLCEEMRIIGFHGDGGFARTVTVPRQSLIPVEAGLDPRLVTFAEPVACVLNGLSRLQPEAGERTIVYGGGVVGMIAALVLRERGCEVTVIEKSAEKIASLQAFCDKNLVALAKDTTAADFDLAINCCASHIAFSLCISKLCKGGRLSYFSGLDKNEEIGTSLLNLVHYKELQVFGSYGPKREDMVSAVAFCVRQKANLASLIERVIHPLEVESVLPRILSGNTLKYIVDFSVQRQVTAPIFPEVAMKPLGTIPQLSPFLADIIARIEPLSQSLRDQAQKKVDHKTKPLGALGRIENLAVRLSTMQKTLAPAVHCPRMFVFAGDHGVVEEGVSAFPAKVTVQMVENFLEGGAAINVFCRQYGIELAVVDMGVNGDFAEHPLLVHQKVSRGTNNFAMQPAMSRDQAVQAIENGARTFLEKNSLQYSNLVGMGEMGIGNSSSATAVICGASRLSAASVGCCVVLDGIISTAAGLLAYRLCPGVAEYLVAGHKSVEKGQQIALEIIGIDPVLDLDLRLGEGTGAAITMNLIDLSCRMMREMASFAEAGVDCDGRRQDRDH